MNDRGHRQGEGGREGDDGDPLEGVDQPDAEVPSPKRGGPCGGHRIGDGMRERRGGVHRVSSVFANGTRGYRIPFEVWRGGDG